MTPGSKIHSTGSPDSPSWQSQSTENKRESWTSLCLHIQHRHFPFGCWDLGRTHFMPLCCTLTSFSLPYTCSKNPSTAARDPCSDLVVILFPFLERSLSSPTWCPFVNDSLVYLPSSNKCSSPLPSPEPLNTRAKGTMLKGEGQWEVFQWYIPGQCKGKHQQLCVQSRVTDQCQLQS